MKKSVKNKLKLTCALEAHKDEQMLLPLIMTPPGESVSHQWESRSVFLSEQNHVHGHIYMGFQLKIGHKTLGCRRYLLGL